MKDLLNKIMIFISVVIYLIGFYHIYIISSQISTLTLILFISYYLLPIILLVSRHQLLIIKKVKDEFKKLKYELRRKN